MQKVTLLGSTGSIGTTTLSIIDRHRSEFQVFALTANSNVEAMFNQCASFHPRFAYLDDAAAATRLKERLSEAGMATEVVDNETLLSTLVSDAEVDTVVAGIVGAAGLLPTLSALKASKKVLLANKESLVMAGRLFMQVAADSKATLIPIDSEHNAIFQCLTDQSSTRIDGKTLSKLVLTASGGPFRELSKTQMARATKAQACNHPNWSMGEKISVDSATMMNKGLELMEASWLFDVAESNIDIVVHPQSIVHSMIQFIDGSTLAQLGNPDMKVPIAHALAFPDRLETGVQDLDLVALSRLDFGAACEETFPCLRLAREACRVGKSAGAVLNAANEVAVRAFLDERIYFGQIAEVNEAVIEQMPAADFDDLESLLVMDTQARALAGRIVQGRS